jgi:CRISPR/Cas system-associated exonuclease Cas4 (RecB family)
MAFLSKSKYLHGLQCPKLLWYEYNRKADVPPPDPQMRSVMEEGKAVGKMAHRLYPDGLKIEWDPNPNVLEQRSRDALALRRPLFEAGFVFEGAYAIADILLPAADDAWDLIEVKSATGIKADYYDDVAFQKYTYTGAGLKIRHCSLMYLDREYLKQGPVQPERLFRREEISETVDAKLPAIGAAVAQLRALIGGPEPEIKVGPQCGNCPLEDLCWSFLPDEGHVFILHRGDKVAFDLMERGIIKIKDIPADYELADRHIVQRQATLSGRRQIDRPALQAFLDQLSYPLFFLDFETIAPAVPVYDLTHPYEDLTETAAAIAALLPG